MSFPRIIRAWCIRRLAALTADAFQVPAPVIPGSWSAALDAYAAFTAEQADRALRSPLSLDAVQARLFSNAEGLGRTLRSCLLVSGPRRAASVMRALYRVIGVDFRGAHGTFAVASCAFASRYSPAACRLISSLDAGLFSGLSNGARLEFRERITEGAPRCAGYLLGGRAG